MCHNFKMLGVLNGTSKPDVLTCKSGFTWAVFYDDLDTTGTGVSSSSRPTCVTLSKTCIRDQ